MDTCRYHGKVVFPNDYPFKPPSIFMLTPNGRFETGRRLCLSMSDFHPELWVRRSPPAQAAAAAAAAAATSCSSSSHSSNS